MSRKSRIVAKQRRQADGKTAQAKRAAGRSARRVAELVVTPQAEMPVAVIESPGSRRSDQMDSRLRGNDGRIVAHLDDGARLLAAKSPDSRPLSEPEPALSPG